MQLPEFESLVQQLLSTDNNIRKNAETLYEQLKKHPDGCLDLLLRCLRQSQQVENRQFCAIMLRKVRWNPDGRCGGFTSSVPAIARTTLHSALLMLPYMCNCMLGPYTRRANTLE